MIVPSSGVKVLIAMKPVDFRKGMDGLAAVVHETLGANTFGGVIYVFRSKRADRVKVLFGTARGWFWRPSVSNRARFAGRRCARG